MSVQGTIEFRVSPVTADDRILAGALPCAWSSSNSSVAQIVGASDENVIDVSTGQAGSTTIGVQLGSLTASVPLTVEN